MHLYLRTDATNASSRNVFVNEKVVKCHSMQCTAYTYICNK